MRSRGSKSARSVRSSSLGVDAERLRRCCSVGHAHHLTGRGLAAIEGKSVIDESRFAEAIAEIMEI